MAVIWEQQQSRISGCASTTRRAGTAGQGAAWTPSKIPKDWVRCEFQLRNDAAASFIRSWQSNGSIGLTFMRDYEKSAAVCLPVRRQEP
ncbi:MAG: hypothetical protein ACLRYE_08365 [Gemmiger formicilis]|uniref:hypothetical protein n=1 Tax=Gemmiger formicilis TaxID=745368 RepID=UPI0039A3D3D5